MSCVAPERSFPLWYILKRLPHSDFQQHTYRQKRSTERYRQTDEALKGETDRQISSTVLSASLIHTKSSVCFRTMEKGHRWRRWRRGSLVFLLPFHARVERTNTAGLARCSVSDLLRPVVSGLHGNLGNGPPAKILKCKKNKR